MPSLPSLHGPVRRIAAVVLTCFGVALLIQAASAQSELSRTELREVQERLKALEYAAGPEDGLYGDKTAAAIRAFERANGMAVSGAADRALLERLRRARTDDQPSQRSQATADSARDRTTGPEGAAGRTSGSGEPGAAASTERSGRSKMAEGTRGEPASPASAEPTVTNGSKKSDGRERELANKTGSLAGTRWRVRDETGATFAITLLAKGRIKGPTIGGDWRWKRRSDQLVIEFDVGPNMSTQRIAPWPGQDDVMKGTAESSTGRTWTWQARKIGDANTSADAAETDPP